MKERFSYNNYLNIFENLKTLKNKVSQLTLKSEESDN